MAYLPPEIVFEILCRVPAVALLRFRCVSKSWRSTIDSPDFIKIHLNQTIRSNSDRKLLFNSRSLYTADFDVLERNDRFVYVELDDHPLKRPDGDCVVIGSCHGLLCLRRHAPGEEEIEDKGVTLWNPTTRKQFKLPFPGYESPGKLRCSTQSLDYGFGYDVVSDDYKILQIIQAYGSYNEVKIFSVKSNSWKKLPPFPYYMQHTGGNGLLHEGSLYWVVRDNEESKLQDLICAFDLATEEFRLVPDLSGRKLVMNVVCFRETRCVSCRSFEFWVQESDAVEEEEPWTKVFRTGFDNLMKPVADSSCGHIVLLPYDYQVLIWYDAEKIETVHSPFLITEAPTSPPPKKFDVYFGSLVQPGSSVGWV